MDVLLDAQEHDGLRERYLECLYGVSKGPGQVRFPFNIKMGKRLKFLYHNI